MSSSLYGGSGASTGSPTRQGATGSSKPSAPSGYKSYQKFTPEQMELFSSMFSHLGPDSYLSKLAAGDEQTFAEMEAPALKQFSGMQGNLASRFSGMGLGGRKSSGFQNTMNQASSDFAMQLQSQRGEMRNQALRDLMSYSNQLLGQEPYGLVEKKEKSNPWATVAGAGIGAGAGFMFGGPMGAMKGAGVGAQVGSAF